MEKVSSQVAVVFPPGVFITMTPFCVGLNVDVVHAYPSAADDAHLRCRLEDCLGDLGLGADGHSRDILHHRQQFLLRVAAVEDDGLQPVLLL